MSQIIIRHRVFLNTNVHQIYLDVDVIFVLCLEANVTSNHLAYV